MPVLRETQPSDAMPELALTGCAPVPLAHYLKALGILRLVSEQLDTTVKAAWRDDRLVLHTEVTRDLMVTFFSREYRPSPVLAPWNGDGGFFPESRRGARETLATIEESGAARLEAYRSSIRAIRSTLDQARMIERPADDQKDALLLALRNELPEVAIGWLDAVTILTTDGAKFPPLLGTGGNDGSLDFSKNLMQRITEVMDTATGEPTPVSRRWLIAALFGEAAPGLATKAPIGQFFPGAAGGANATSGFDAPSAVNPWDFILMIEGALLFAAASVKRLESAGEGALIYPFCVRQAGVGYASAAGSDEAEARCEMWLPLWERPTSLAELHAVFGEGRAQVRGRPARNGVDFAQAVVTLGVDRGLTAFQRYGFQVRNGLSYFATPLERVVVRRNKRVDLLADTERWHDRLRQKAGPKANPEPPASVARSLNQLERRILELCRDGGNGTLLAVLAALGAAECALAKSFKWTTDNYIQPLRGLTRRWLELADDGSSEFRLAAALASVRASVGKDTLWVRQHLEPLEMGSTGGRAWVSWADQPGNDVVWHAGDLASVLNAILLRRLVRFEKAGTGGWGDIASRFARLDDITAFIEGRVNEELLANLLWGIACVDHGDSALACTTTGESQRFGNGNSDIVPSALYAQLKLCHHPCAKGEQSIPLVPAILIRAMNGDGKAASELASRRLTASGCRPLIKSLPVSGDVARRTAAAMLFPISNHDFRLLKQSITHKPKEQTA
jgi:CRISPR-associated protein Csx17